MASSVWQCAQPARCVAAFGSREGLSIIRFSVFSGRHLWWRLLLLPYLCGFCVVGHDNLLRGTFLLCSCLPAFCCFIQFSLRAYQEAFVPLALSVEHRVITSSGFCSPECMLKTVFSVSSSVSLMSWRNVGLFFRSTDASGLSVTSGSVSITSSSESICGALARALTALRQ